MLYPIKSRLSRHSDTLSRHSDMKPLGASSATPSSRRLWQEDWQFGAPCCIKWTQYRVFSLNCIHVLVFAQYFISFSAGVSTLCYILSLLPAAFVLNVSITVMDVHCPHYMLCQKPSFFLMFIQGDACDFESGIFCRHTTLDVSKSASFFLLPSVPLPHRTSSFTNVLL